MEKPTLTLKKKLGAHKKTKNKELVESARCILATNFFLSFSSKSLKSLILLRSPRLGLALSFSVIRRLDVYRKHQGGPPEFQMLFYLNSPER